MMGNLSLRPRTLKICTRIHLGLHPAQLVHASEKLDLRLRVFYVPDKKSHSAPFSAFMFIPTLLRLILLLRLSPLLYTGG